MSEALLHYPLTGFKPGVGHTGECGADYAGVGIPKPGFIGGDAVGVDGGCTWDYAKVSCGPCLDVLRSQGRISARNPARAVVDL